MKEQMYHFKPVWYMSSLRGALEDKTRKDTTLIKKYIYPKAQKIQMPAYRAPLYGSFKFGYRYAVTVIHVTPSGEGTFLCSCKLFYFLK